VPDEREAIVDEVSRAVASSERVVTSGGIGPTHDDITVECVGAALGRAMELRMDLLERLGRAGVVPDAATRRMATLPVGAEVRMVGRLPVLTVGPVLVLPGVPSLFRLGFEAEADGFRGDAPWVARVWTVAPEHRFAEALTLAVAGLSGVKVGSYPRWEEGSVLLTVEGPDREAVERGAGVVAAVVAAQRVEPAVRL
jgi:molybdopterin-biosynthesis enzyme MoeA-like protein